MKASIGNVPKLNDIITMSTNTLLFSLVSSDKFYMRRKNPKIKWDQMRILVVEDEPDLRDILVTIFEQEGSHVLAAKDGCEALTILQTENPDFVISDVRMPKLDGIQFLEIIRRRHPSNPPVFLATGFADIDEAQALRKGAISLIAKPFHINDLLTEIEDRLIERADFNKRI
jgi:CheY-like chemotaxis protein